MSTIAGARFACLDALEDAARHARQRVLDAAGLIPNDETVVTDTRLHVR